MANNSKEPLRDAPVHIDDNGKHKWASSCSHSNNKTRAACEHPIQLPGLIIFVHGVNSEGEWYDDAERNLCLGLTKRLNLTTELKLKENKYSDGRNDIRSIIKEGRSPIIRFYWGYSAGKCSDVKYQIPLRNTKGEDYHDLKKYRNLSDSELKAKGPFYWGGGAFQNGCDQLASLWSKEGFSKWLKEIPIPFSVQAANNELDRLISDAPARQYYAHAASRLANLIDTIRNDYPKDTITVMSHSQGTMIAMAATLLAKTGPDSLFVMNSPYALEHKTMDRFSYPFNECISTKARIATFENIVKKVAQQANRMTSADYSRLVVGVDANNKSWKPTGMGPNDTYERDNHGRTWVYCNAHDRVMGMKAIRSIGWQGIPNTPDGKINKLLTDHRGHLFQRMMARGLRCGGDPLVQTPFGTLPPTGSPFWDDGGEFIYPAPPANQMLFINGEKVPAPFNIPLNFDGTRVGDKSVEGSDGKGWGQYHEDKLNDETFPYYASLYEEQWISVPSSTTRTLPGSQEVTRGQFSQHRETREQKNARIGKFISQPSDHSTLPLDPYFMSRVVAYDLPIGFCECSNNKSDLEKYRRLADWQISDPYFTSGEHPHYTRPAEVIAESAGGMGPDELAKMKQMEIYKHGGR
mgnify:CR=1 FL=1